MIAFIGSVFSPYYFRSRHVTPLAAPEDHCAVNAALYGRNVRRWTMTERNRHDLQQGQSSLGIGSSVLAADSSKLVLAIRERTALLGVNVIGTVTVTPTVITDFRGILDESAKHSWYPLAPHVHVEANFERPSLSWSGVGYLDMNRGSEALEDGFAHWNWSRATLKNETAILYDLSPRTGSPLNLSLRIDASGAVEMRELPKAHGLPRTPVWRMPRATRSDIGARPRVYRTLEDTPFYSRSMISTQVFGESAVAMHESLSLDRFKTRTVQTMLPYRMPRAAGCA